MKALFKFAVQVTYNVGFILFFLITGWFLLYRLWRRGKLLAQFGQRLGFYSKDVKQKLAPGTDIWIHAVSVGEVAIARVVLLRLREMKPDVRAVISCTTPTGRDVAKKRLEDERTVVIYNPLDFLWSVVHAFKLIRPKLLILVESEVWPNYLWCAKRRRIPIYLINARLSDRSAERYRKLRRIVRPLLADIDLVFAQHASEVERLTHAGFPPESVFNLGSIKYDVAEQQAVDGRNVDKEKAINDWWEKTGWNGDQKILLGGSTHPGEEEVLARIFSQLRETEPKLRLVLAPRHAERGEAIREMCDKLGLRAVTRSQLAGTQAPLNNGSTPDVLVVNSTGELGALYKRATLAFIGKSLRGHGGQNFIEAAAVGAPIVLGPNMENFRVLTREYLERQAVVQISDEFELANCLRALFASDEVRRDLGQSAKATSEAYLGAAKRTANVILHALENRR